MLRTEAPKLDYLVEPLLVRGASTVLAGREGVGKSLFALALASGQPVGPLTPTGTFRTLYVDSENGQDESHRRLQALGFRDDTPIEYLMIESGFRLTEHYGVIFDHIAEVDPDLVILDSMRSLAQLDENDPRQVTAALGPWRRLAQHRKLSVLMLHHSGKGLGAQAFTGSPAWATEAGHGLFTFARGDNDPQSKTRRKLSAHKTRSGEEADAAWLEIHTDGASVGFAVAEPYRPSATGGDSATGLMTQRMVQALAEGGEMSTGELCAAVGTQQNGTAKAAIRAAVEAGDIVRPTKPDGTPERGRYRLANDGRSDRPAVRPSSESDGPTGPLGLSSVRPTGGDHR